MLPADVPRILAAGGGAPLVLEAIGTTDAVRHRVGIGAARSGAVAAQLRQVVPGLDLLPITRARLPLTRAVALGLSTRRRQLRLDAPDEVSRGLLSALSHVGAGESLTLQWYLTRVLVPTSVPNRTRGVEVEGLPSELLLRSIHGSSELDPEIRAAMRSKQAEFGWRATGRIGVNAASRTRERQLVRQVLSALRVVEAPGVGFRVTSAPVRAVQDVSRPWLSRMRVNTSELSILSAWPSGSIRDLPVNVDASVRLRAPRNTPSAGRVLGDTKLPGRTRPVAMSPRDSLRHLHVVGPTGTGKSTLLCNLIVQDIEDGRGVVVIEPLGGLIREVLARVPASRADDVVVLDPTDASPVGLNPLARDGRPPELVADQLLGVLHDLYASSWGPRTSDVLGCCLQLLASTPGASLVNLPLLLANASYRRRLTRHIDDPIRLGPFFSQFEAWSDAERAAVIAPSMNKLRPFFRPELRGVFGQSTPRFRMTDILTKRRILLVNLAKGQLGPEASALMGAMVVSSLWQAVLSRSGIEQSRRHPTYIYVDEFQSYLKLPVDLADALAQARGLGVGLVLAHQYLNQLDPSTRSAVLNNAQSRIAFRLAHEDAVALATPGGPAAQDFEGLSAFDAYAQLVVGGTVGRWFSLHTRPLPPTTSDPDELLRRSASRYGTPVADVNRALRELVDGHSTESRSDIGRRRRRGEAR